MQHNSFIPILLVLSILVFAGCNNPDARFARVEGTITYNGEAVEGAIVTFAPVDEIGEAASGLTDANGRYTMTTAGAHNAGSGVVPAEYTILVTKTVSSQVTDPDELANQRGEITYEELQQRLRAKGGSTTVVTRQEMLPQKYGRPNLSTLTATVNSGRNSPFNFDLTD
ncbi:MAG: carboxypeptidase-like regulatory domain-containing protein [Planctomycetaceae bacterium]|nr:carboxypeptidase-like regulatory domain-containing protein [Planctomycetaceae bacterium]